MAAKRKDSANDNDRLRAWLIRGMPAWIVLCGVVTIMLPGLGDALGGLIIVDFSVDERRLETAPVTLAPLFTAEVDHWADDIVRWAGEYGLDPNLVATIMQIESCGDPGVSSPAGASGLMQVMPQHFSADQNPLDPETNARRGLDIYTECLYSPYNLTNDVGMAFACYNGGPSVLVNAWDYWPQQSRDYYIWGTNIYADAQTGAAQSDTLDRWLAAGGESLCLGARQTLELVPSPAPPPG